MRRLLTGPKNASVLMSMQLTMKVKVKSLGCVWLFVTPWTVGSSPWNLIGSSIHGIFQARVLEWVAISFSRGSSRPRDRTWVSRIASRCFYCLSQQGSSPAHRDPLHTGNQFHLLCQPYSMGCCRVREDYELELSGKVSWDQLVMLVNGVQCGSKDTRVYWQGLKSFYTCCH